MPEFELGGIKEVNWPLFGVEIVCLFAPRLSALNTLFLITKRRFYWAPAAAPDPFPVMAACAMALLALSLSTSELFRT